MAQLSSLTSVFLFLLAFLSVKMITMHGCQLSVIGGGCPDSKECLETCRPCYRGVGVVRAFCRPAGGGIPYDECVCSMENGASCHPQGPPQCPRPWPPPPTTSADNVNGTLSINGNV